MASLALALIGGPDDPRAQPPELAQALELAQRAVQQDGNSPEALLALCDVAVAEHKAYLLEDCAPQLLRLRPDDPYALVFASIQASEERRDADATALANRARDRGLDSRTLAMLAQEIAPPPTPWATRLKPIAAEVGEAWLGVLGLLLAAGSMLSAITRRLAARVAAGTARGAGPVLRVAYRSVIALCVAFYFASLPLLCAVTIAMSIAVVYAFFAAGVIPIYFCLAILAGGTFTVVAMLGSVFAATHSAEPGIELDLAAEPRLAALLREVADRMQTRPIDRVRIAPDAGLFVYEAHRRRTLCIGVALLEGLTVGPLRAMLAHEYGHFVGKDTAGGALSLAMQQSFGAMARDLTRLGLGQLYNPAWMFLHAYEALFLQVSGGAMRLQEILADRRAAMAYGGESLERGLRHSNLSGARFQLRLMRLARDLAAGRADASRLYDADLGPEVEQRAHELAEKRWTRPAEEEDSHPPPFERVAWMKNVAPEIAVPGADDPAWTVFSDRALLQSKALTLLRPASSLSPRESGGTAMPGAAGA